MKTRAPKQEQSSLSSRLKYIARGVSGLSTMEESLEITRYVPTIFPSFNRAIVLKGAPLGCVWTVHGEYAGGKSTMTIGLLKSFIEGGHLGALIDAEHATSKTWLLQLGIDPSSFLYYRPDTMEDATDMIDSLVANFDEGRKDGTIPKDKGMIIILDSINKLTPKSEWERFKKEGSDALDKGLARYRGLLLQSWYDHMTPIIGKRDIALVCIAQEREIQTKNIYDPSFKVKGCQGALFDSFVQLRVLKGEKLWLEKGSGKVKKKILVGMGHRFIVFKNKVGFPNETGTFFTSNGKGFIPIGFNHAKTAIDEAIMRGGIIEQNGGWYAWHGNKWNGENAFICALHEDPDLLGDLQLELDNSIDTFFFSNSTQQYKSETNE